MPYVFWFSDDPSGTVTAVLAAIGAVIGMIIYFPAQVREGRRQRRAFIAAGGDPTGISLRQFGVMGGHQLPDGRWQWSQESSSSE